MEEVRSGRSEGPSTLMGAGLAVLLLMGVVLGGTAAYNKRHGRYVVHFPGGQVECLTYAEEGSCVVGFDSNGSEVVRACGQYAIELR